MNRKILAAVLCAAAPVAFAQEDDCFPGCAEAPAAPAPTLDLCQHHAVREAVRIERDLRPVKRVYDIAMNPAGFVIEKVSDEVGVKIPKWVGYAMDPKGAARNYVMKRVREEVKKNAGLAHDCEMPEEIEEDGAYDGAFPQPENDRTDA